MSGFLNNACVIVVGLSCMLGCNSVGPIGVTDLTIQRTIVVGQVLDEQAQPIAGVEVSVSGKTTLTTDLGGFAIYDVDLPVERALIKAHKPGFMDSYRAVKPSTTGQTQIHLRMTSDDVTTSFQSSEGAQIKVQGTFTSAVLPTNAYVSADGKTYNGLVNVCFRTFNPDDSQFYDYVSGDLTGLRTDSSIGQLTSYGVMRLTLSDAAGNKLQLAPKTSATLTMQIPASLSATAPSTIPLWTFDQSDGRWKEEGVATKVGLAYVGTVTHFTDWNFDAVNRSATLNLKVRCDNGIVGGMLVNVGQRQFFSDADGMIRCLLPVGERTTIQVRAEYNDGYSSDAVVVDPLTFGQTVDAEVTIHTCCAFVKGRLNGCDAKTIDGLVIGSYANGSYAYGYSTKGAFAIRVRSAEYMTFSVTGSNANTSGKIVVAPLHDGEIRDLGVIPVCASARPVFRDTVICSANCSGHYTYPGVKFSADGSTIVTYIGGQINVFNATTMQKLQSISLDMYGCDSTNPRASLDISDDGKIALIKKNYTDWATYDLQTGRTLAIFKCSSGDDGHLSPNGSTVVLQDYSQIAVFNARSGAFIYQPYFTPLVPVYSMSDFVNNDQMVVCFGITPDTLYGYICLINVKDGSFAKNFGFNQTLSLKPFGPVSPDGNWIYFNGIQLNSKTGEMRGFDHFFRYEASPALFPDNLRYISEQAERNDSPFVIGVYSLYDAKLLMPLVAGMDRRDGTFAVNKTGTRAAVAYLYGSYWALRVWDLND